MKSCYGIKCISTEMFSVPGQDFNESDQTSCNLCGLHVQDIICCEIINLESMNVLFQDKS